MATIANRGKWAEGRLKSYFKKLESVSFTHYRFPDARAGSFVVAPCDFMFMRSGHMTMVEVKEVNHAFRLPHKNFSPDQVARMRNWASAGAGAFVLIYFEPIKAWRVIPVDTFLAREGGSWDLSGIVPVPSEEEAFSLLFK